MGIHAEHPKLGHRLIGKKILHPLAGSFLLLTTASAADAGMILRLEEVGGDVVVRGSGTINLSGLSLKASPDDYTNIFTSIQLYAGPANIGDGVVDQWSGMTGPSTIGTDDSVVIPADAGTGDLFGVVSDDRSDPGGTRLPLLVLPRSYVSGTALNGTTQFVDQSFAKMGISPGTLTWTLPSADTVTITTDAEPVPAPLGVASAAAVFSTIRRLKQNTRILQLAARKPKAISTTLPD
jgi:hypothetical protein